MQGEHRNFGRGSVELGDHPQAPLGELISCPTAHDATRCPPSVFSAWIRSIASATRSDATPSQRSSSRKLRPPRMTWRWESLSPGLTRPRASRRCALRRMYRGDQGRDRGQRFAASRSTGSATGAWLRLCEDYGTTADLGITKCCGKSPDLHVL